MPRITVRGIAKRLRRFWRENFGARPNNDRLPPRPPRQPRALERVLFVRPDTYGDLILFEPALRALRAAWPRVEIGLLVRSGYLDLQPIFPPGLTWLTTEAEPYRNLPHPRDPAVVALRHTVEAFAPDLVVGACYSATWVEYLAAAFAPNARALRLGRAPLEIGSAQALAATLGALHFRHGRWPVRVLEDYLFPERVEVPEEAPEVEKSRALVGYLLRQPVAALVPELIVSPGERAAARDFLAGLGLTPEGFLAVCPAGTANVAIKAWPASHFAEVVAEAERRHGLPSLLLGSDAERPVLEAIASEARRRGATAVRLATGARGSFPQLAARLALAKAFLGNDTGTLHAAGALQRPVLGVYGGGTWPRFAPAGPAASAAVLRPMDCFGCGWDCAFGDAPCLGSVPVSAVLDALAWLLEAPAGERRRFAERPEPEPSERSMTAAALRLREAQRLSAARQRQVADLEDRVAGCPEPLPLDPPQDQLERLRHELRLREEELRATRRVLAHWVARGESPKPRPPP